MIDSCRLVSQSNYLNNSKKERDWLILADFFREQNTLTSLLLVCFEHANKYFYHKTNNETSTVLFCCKALMKR